jgi:hypothetical protein
MELFEFINIYKYYAPIFQIILPLIIYFIAEIKIKIKKKHNIQIKLT